MSTVPLNPASAGIATNDNRERSILRTSHYEVRMQRMLIWEIYLTFQFIDLRQYSKVTSTNSIYFHSLVGIQLYSYTD